MDLSKSLVLIASLSCLFLSASTNAVPTSRSRVMEESEHDMLLHSIVTGDSSEHEQAPAPEPKSLSLGDLCKEAQNPNLCSDTIKAELHEDVVHPVKALQVEMEATRKEAEKVSEKINKLKEESSDDVKSSLKTCEEQYSAMKDTIEECSKMIEKNEFYTAWMKFGSVISFREACEDSLKEWKESSKPFAEESRNVYDLGGNSLAILMNLSGEKLPN